MRITSGGDSGGSLTQDLIDDFWAPDLPPSSPCAPDADTVSWHAVDNADVVLEVFRRAKGLYGFRYQVWVAWRDAGGVAQSHSWYAFQPEGLVTDDLVQARAVAESHAQSKQLEFAAPWRNPA